MNKIKIFPLSPQTQIEASIAFMCGILLGVLTSAVYLIFVLNWGIWWKILTAIGEIGIIGNLLLALKQLLEQRKGLLEAQKQFGMPNRNKEDKPEYIQ